MARQSVMVLGTNMNQVKAKANSLLEGKNHEQHHSDIIEAHRIVITEPRDDVGPDDIPEFIWPKIGGVLYMVHATYEE